MSSFNPFAMVMTVAGTLIGLLMGSPKQPKLEPQRLGELRNQTAKEGEPRPIVYGIGRPIGGNIMYQSRPIVRMVKTLVGQSGGGKGGSKKKNQYQDVEHVYRYYAVRVCEGPISGYRRIWRNNVLVYDARTGSAWGAANNHLFFKNFKLYTGGWDQMPDPSLQSKLGTTNIPAFRGTAYLMASNEDLTDTGGMIPQWIFEVARSEGMVLTSRPYALEARDSTKATGAIVKKAGNDTLYDFISTVGAKSISVDFRNVFNSTELEIDALSATGVNGLAVFMKNNAPTLHAFGVLDGVSSFGALDVEVHFPQVVKYSQYNLGSGAVDGYGVSQITIDMRKR